MSSAAQSRLRTVSTALYLWTHILLGIAVGCWTVLNWNPDGELRYGAYLVSALIASLLKVRMPGVTGTVSVSFLFVLIGIVDLGVPEAVSVAALSMAAQCIWRTQRRPTAMQVTFSISSVTIATYVSSRIYSYAHGIMLEPLALGVLAFVYYYTNTFPVAGIIALTESKRLWTVSGRNRWLLPYYAGATSLAWMIGTMPRAIQWEVPLICLPVVYVVHRSYRTHLTQIEQEMKHVAEVNSLHLRTIEALALAIDAKDHTTHDHLQRVQLYALEVGKDLGLSESELEALRAASVLHDIGKLAVPEYIITKPGKLTPAEFEKMKIHPVVGAEILERVEFPYPVVPIVRAHHEKWDGSGYPYGVKGTDIPIGARILAAVDCLDALASDRQYRRALPLDDAMAKVASESGTSFDPAVVNALQRRYRELEARAQQLSAEARATLSTDIQITRGGAPAAGFESSGNGHTPAANFERTPVRRLARVYAPGASALGDLAIEEVLAIFAIRIKSVVPYQAIAFFVSEGATVRPEFATGEDSAALVSLRVPIGEGLAGWVAQARRPILNGNPAVEPGYSGERRELRSALAIPIELADSTVAVLTLYRREGDAFSADDLAALQPLSRPLARVFNSSTTAEAVELAFAERASA